MTFGILVNVFFVGSHSGMSTTMFLHWKNSSRNVSIVTALEEIIKKYILILKKSWKKIWRENFNIKEKWEEGLDICFHSDAFRTEDKTVLWNGNKVFHTKHI